MLGMMPGAGAKGAGKGAASPESTEQAEVEQQLTGEGAFGEKPGIWDFHKFAKLKNDIRDSNLWHLDAFGILKIIASVGSA